MKFPWGRGRRYGCNSRKLDGHTMRLVLEFEVSGKQSQKKRRMVVIMRNVVEVYSTEDALDRK